MIIDILEERAVAPKKCGEWDEIYWYTGRQVLVMVGLTDQSWEEHAEEPDRIITILDKKYFFPPGVHLTRKVDWIEATLCIEFAPKFIYPGDEEEAAKAEKRAILPDLREYMRISRSPPENEIKPSPVTHYRSYVDRVLRYK
jgi:hypothetical protein